MTDIVILHFLEYQLTYFNVLPYFVYDFRIKLTNSYNGLKTSWHCTPLIFQSIRSVSPLPPTSRLSVTNHAPSEIVTLSIRKKVCARPWTQKVGEHDYAIFARSPTTRVTGSVCERRRGNRAKSSARWSAGPRPKLQSYEMEIA